ncbi:MAG: radical SAM protein, partial [Treponema sp.]|nr:radical SAM protein [Treponema sp.]
MNVLIIQPPIVQLNTPYPSGAYLSAFFKSLGHRTKWLDMSLELFYEIFSHDGLTKLFSLCSQNALTLADRAEKKGDDSTAFNLRRYVSQKELWIQWIDFITAVLRPGSRNSVSSGYENAHRFVFGAHVPRGARMENYLSNLGHDLTTDDARSLASFALADLADFITAAFDKNFSLVRYAESLTVSESSFAEVEKGADSPILKEFYIPLLEKCEIQNAEFGINVSSNEKFMVLISVPFAGTFAAALATGRFFKEYF